MADLDYAKVVGRFALTAGDTAGDVDDDPDIIWCDEGRVILTPLTTYAKVPGGAPDPFSVGNAQIEATIDSEGYLTYLGKRYVHVVDLTSPKVNPQIGAGLATHRVTFTSVRAGGTPVEFPEVTVRLTAAGDANGENDLTLVMPVTPGEATPIVQGPRGVGVETMAVQGGDLVVTLDDASVVNAGALPVGPGGSDPGVASYITTPGTETEKALSASYARKAGDPGSWMTPADSPEHLAPTVVRYQPASLVQNQTPTDNTWEDLDATNLSITVVCPPSGKIEFTLSAITNSAAFDQGVIWGLRDTASGLRIADSVTSIIKGDADDGESDQSSQAVFVVTKRGDGAALTPGVAYTFVWQQRAARDAVFSATQYGGTGVNGAAIIRAQPLSNRLPQKIITATVTADPAVIPHAVGPDGYKMVGQMATGSPTLTGRLAFSNDRGLTWTELPNLVTPVGASQAFFANDGEILVVAGINSTNPGSIWKSSGWSNPLTATFTKVLSANNAGGNNVYFGNYSGYHVHGGICVVNEYGPKSATEMARYVYATEDHGDTWRTILDLRGFIQARVPDWDGNDAHVHGSAYDPYWDAMWVVTGDYDGAGTLPYTLVSFDWRSNNPIWHIVYSRHQFTSVVPMRDCILFGTDGGQSYADEFGNGFLRLPRIHPSVLTQGHEQRLEAAYIYDDNAGITVIALGYSRIPWVKDAPYLLALGESGAVGPTGRILSTHDGYSFREVWTATDIGTTGAVGRIIGPYQNKITASYQASTDGYQKQLVTLSLS